MSCNRGRTNGFVRFLRILRLGLELARLFGNVVLAVALRDDLAYFVYRDLGQRYRIGTHIGYEADITFAGQLDTFVKPLRRAHGALRIEPELARCFLLQCGRREGRCRIAATLLPRDAERLQFPVRRVEQCFLDLARGRFVLEAELFDLVALVGDEP